MITLIISRGQTGADKGGLQAARILGIPTAGFCPAGYMTENGQDLSLKEFSLTETYSDDYKSRAIKNIDISDGSVIFSITNINGEIIGGGSNLTFKMCKELNKPVIVNPSREEFIKWIKDKNIKKLNVAGNRESQNIGLQSYVKHFLVHSLMNYIKTKHDAVSEYKDKFIKIINYKDSICEIYGKYKGIKPGDTIRLKEEDKTGMYKVLEVKYFTPHSDEFFGEIKDLESAGENKTNK